ncbi:MAG: MTH938/NDUFAF3 family protein [Gammaproteobacteria bacterium]
MKLHLEKCADLPLIHSCEAPAKREAGARHRIRIDGATYDSSLIITARGVEMWEVRDARALCLADFERLAALCEEVLLLGAGRRAVFPHAAFTVPLMRARIGLEVMDTPAACRTYNILAGDGRKVTAALIA